MKTLHKLLSIAIAITFIANGSDTVLALQQRSIFVKGSEDKSALSQARGAGYIAEADISLDGAEALVDLEHFVHAQNRLATHSLTETQLSGLLERLDIVEVGLTTEDKYAKVYEKFAERGYSKEIIDFINGDTYLDPRLSIEIIGQNKNPRAQSVYEAVANSLDALGFKIGQFGKGVKQVIDWLNKMEGGRIDVFTKREGGKAYRLTIINGRLGRKYIQIKQITDEESRSAAGEEFRHGTIVRISVKTPIPLTDKDRDSIHYNSQEEIENGIHRRFPYITSARITTKKGGNRSRKVNGFEHKTAYTKRGTVRYDAKESEGKDISVLIDARSITIIDNGTGMDAEIISRMFVPKQGTKHPRPLSWQDSSLEDREKVKVVHDASLPHRVSFARNGEVIVSIDIPGDIIKESTAEGGLMIEGGAFIDVPESRDNIIIPVDLKPGEKSNFQNVIEYAVDIIIESAGLSNPEKIRYINTIVIGLDGLIQGNENYGQTIKQTRAAIYEKLGIIAGELRRDGFIILPHDKQYEKLAIPRGKKVLFLHEKIFDWKCLQDINELGAEKVPGITLGGDRKIPLFLAPFKEESLIHIRGLNRGWHELGEEERIPIVRTGKFIILPAQIGSRLMELAKKRLAEKLNAEEEDELNFILQLVTITAAEQVVTNYETGRVTENLTIAPAAEYAWSTGEIDSGIVNGFLADVPLDAKQRFMVTNDGRIREIGTNRIIPLPGSPEERALVCEFIYGGFYKIVTDRGVYLCEYEHGEMFIRNPDYRKNATFVTSPDRRYCYFTYEGGILRGNEIFDLSNGQRIEIEASGCIVEGIEFSDDNRYMTYLMRGAGMARLVRYDLARRKREFVPFSETLIIKSNALQRRGTYRHPQFNLMVDNTDPESPKAADISSGRVFEFRGEIIWYDGRNLMSVSGGTNYWTAKSSTAQGEKETFMVPIGKEVSRFFDTENKKLFRVTKLEDRYYFEKYDFARDECRTFGPEIPVSYTSVSPDGRYFVFVNPKTGDAAYLDQEKPEKPIFVNVISPDEQDARISVKTALVAQIRSAYMPFFKLLPAEFKGVSGSGVEYYLEGLYKRQEDEVRKLRFRNINIADPSLPFSRFSANMRRILPRLDSYLESIAPVLRQENNDVQRQFYEHLFSMTFKFCTDSEFIDTGLFENNMLFNVLAYGWTLTSAEKIEAVKTIWLFTELLKEQKADIAAIIDIIMFLSAVPDTAIVVKQVNKILCAEIKFKNRFARELAKVNADKGFFNLWKAFRRIGQPSALIDLGQARPFMVFFTNDVEQVEKKVRSAPNGTDISMPNIALSQIVLLEQNRKKDPHDPEDIVMSVDYLILRINECSEGRDVFPDPSEALEAEILRNTTVQRESGAYTAEIAQNSIDAAKGMDNGELVIDFYIQDGETGEEYVEEAADNGTGALKEAALLIPKSTKEAGGQSEFTGFFGTGKFTIFEGADRVEIITKNSDRAYMFTFIVRKDKDGNSKAVRLAGIKRIDDPAVKQGVTVRRIKKVSNTIPELDQMLAQRAWKTFAGMAQSEKFKIYFIDHNGERQALTVKKELLSEADFKARMPGENRETNFGKMRIFGVKDMPLQIVDKAGLRVCEIKEEYLSLIPPSLRRHIRDLGVIIQIPLPLIRGRSAFEYESYYLPVIQKYIAIEFYKAVVYKTLTSKDSSFVFENLPLDWEINPAYWDSINLNSFGFTRLKDKIDNGRCGDIDIETELKPLLHEEGKLDKDKNLLMLLLSLEVVTSPDRPRESLLLRRLAIQERIDAESLQRQREALAKAGLTAARLPDIDDIPNLDEKMRLGDDLAKIPDVMAKIENYFVTGHTAGERKFLERALSIMKHFGVKQVFLVRSVPFGGLFTTYKGEKTVFLNVDTIRQKDIAGVIDKATDTIIHELAHFLESGMREDMWVKGYPTSDLTHDAKGVFGEGMRYAAAIVLAGYGLPEESSASPFPVDDVSLQELIARAA